VRIRAVVDQIEVGKALILLGEEQTSLIWPVEQLPQEIKEGDVVYIEVKIDHEETEAVRSEAKRRIEELLKRTENMERGQQ
jgi:hypothetical protein